MRKIDQETNPTRAALMQRWGREISRARRAMGYSQQEAAALLGVPRATLRSWEMGRRACTLATRRRIVAEWRASAEALETEHEWCPHCGRPYELVANCTRPRAKSRTPKPSQLRRRR